MTVTQFLCLHHFCKDESICKCGFVVKCMSDDPGFRGKPIPPTLIEKPKWATRPNFPIQRMNCYWISREKFEPELGFEPRISRSLAWRSYQLSYPSSYSSSCSNVPLETINAKRFSLFTSKYLKSQGPVVCDTNLPSVDH